MPLLCLSLLALCMMLVQSTGNYSTGNPGCPCLNMDAICLLPSSYTVNSSGEAGSTHIAFSGSSTGVARVPKTYGSNCQAWDSMADVQYDILCSGSNPPSRCRRVWCMVDVCDCNATDMKPSRYFAALPSPVNMIKLGYSYDTCDASNAGTSGAGTSGQDLSFLGCMINATKPACPSPHGPATPEPCLCLSSVDASGCAQVPVRQVVLFLDQHTVGYEGVITVLSSLKLSLLAFSQLGLSQLFPDGVMDSRTKVRYSADASTERIDVQVVIINCDLSNPAQYIKGSFCLGEDNSSLTFIEHIFKGENVLRQNCTMGGQPSFALLFDLRGFLFTHIVRLAGHLSIPVITNHAVSTIKSHAPIPLTTHPHLDILRRTVLKAANTFGHQQILLWHCEPSSSWTAAQNRSFHEGMLSWESLALQQEVELFTAALPQGWDTYLPPPSGSHLQLAFQRGIDIWSTQELKVATMDGFGSRCPFNDAVSYLKYVDKVGPDTKLIAWSAYPDTFVKEVNAAVEQQFIRFSPFAKSNFFDAGMIVHFNKTSTLLETLATFLANIDLPRYSEPWLQEHIAFFDTQTLTQLLQGFWRLERGQQFVDSVMVSQLAVALSTNSLSATSITSLQKALAFDFTGASGSIMFDTNGDLHPQVVLRQFQAPRNCSALY